MEIALKEDERYDYLFKENLTIIQSPSVFSFSLDAVLLAHFAQIPRVKPAKIVDLCSGNGVIPLLLSDKTQNNIIGVEIQEKLVDMARRSCQINRLEHRIQIIHEDIRQLFQTIRKDSIDIITCNPPYFKTNETNFVNHKESYSLARHEVALPLEDLLKVMSGLLKMRGKAYMVHRPDRLSDILTIGRKYRLEAKRIQWIHPIAEKESNMVLVELMKDGKPGGLVISKPIIVFNEDRSYTEEVRSIFFGNEN